MPCGVQKVIIDVVVIVIVDVISPFRNTPIFSPDDTLKFSSKFNRIVGRYFFITADWKNNVVRYAEIL